MCYKNFFGKPLQQVHCQYDEKTLRYQSQDILCRCCGFKILKFLEPVLLWFWFFIDAYPLLLLYETKGNNLKNFEPKANLNHNIAFTACCWKYLFILTLQRQNTETGYFLTHFLAWKTSLMMSTTSIVACWLVA